MTTEAESITTITIPMELFNDLVTVCRWHNANVKEKYERRRAIEEILEDYDPNSVVFLEGEAESIYERALAVQKVKEAVL